MKQSILFAAILLLALTNCKNATPENTEESVINTVPMLTQEIIKGYAVKDSSGVMVKDSLQQMQSITYDVKGRERSNIFFNLDGQKQWEDVYEYNEDNFKTGSKYYEGGEHKITYKYESDSLGRRLKFIAFEASSGTALYDGYSTYEKDGTIRKDGFKDKAGMIRWQYEYLFDKDQNELGYVYIDTRTQERYESFYKVVRQDSIGRWTQREIINNDLVMGIEERIFEYQ